MSETSAHKRDSISALSEFPLGSQESVVDSQESDPLLWEEARELLASTSARDFVQCIESRKFEAPDKVPLLLGIFPASTAMDHTLSLGRFFGQFGLLVSGFRFPEGLIRMCVFAEVLRGYIRQHVDRQEP